MTLMLILKVALTILNCLGLILIFGSIACKDEQRFSMLAAAVTVSGLAMALNLPMIWR